MSGILEIVFWDVQRGSSIYIKTPGGKNIIQDLGKGKWKDDEEKTKEFSPLTYLKDEYHINKLDRVIITHPHKDHIDDIMNLDLFNIGKIITPCLSKREIKEKLKIGQQDRFNQFIYLYEKYFNISERYFNMADLIYMFDKIKIDELILDFWKWVQDDCDLKIKTFIPNFDSPDINDYSIVTSISYNDVKILLPGDNSPRSWVELLKNKEFINSIKDTDIFLAPHHGLKSGFYEELFEYFKPKLTIISDKQTSETSITQEYTNRNRGEGINVYNRKSGITKKRKSLTTRDDGAIYIRIGSDSSIYVTIGYTGK